MALKKIKIFIALNVYFDPLNFVNTLYTIRGLIKDYDIVMLEYRDRIRKLEDAFFAGSIEEAGGVLRQKSS